jgi:(1->4)-alpha-D-glucan 1-alpha-D-glucosylmutase
MAKGGEDTAFYRYNRLVPLNEVGGEPDRFGIPVEEFHHLMKRRAEVCPHSMLCTSTHDTKRSEDVRARLHLLTEIPRQWEVAVGRWSSMNCRYRRRGMPDRNTEYLIYQTLVGAWPIEADRLISYMKKASREAKVHSSWTDPDRNYEEGLQTFISSILENADFQRDLCGFVAPLINPGRCNSLAQTLIKLTAPGTPDIYQGTELWDLSLVDPDNRRPVDFMIRRSLLREIEDAGESMFVADGGSHTAGVFSIDAVVSRMEEGLPKLWVIRQALALRRKQPQLFGEGASYTPVNVVGEKERHAVCFMRAGKSLTIVPRFPLLLKNEWCGTAVVIPGGTWRNLLSGEMWEGETIPLDRLLRSFPLALLLRQ